MGSRFASAEGVQIKRHSWQAVPILTSLRGYHRAWLKRDLIAGVLIVALAVPLSMGMAEVAGMPPVVGLYSCVLPLVAFALFGSSRQVVVALDASTAAMLGAAIAPLAGGDPLKYAALAGGITLVVGVVLALAGVARLGLIADFLSEPVLLGYQAGIAIIVIGSQLPRLLGLELTSSSTVGLYVGALTHLSRANVWSILLAFGALILVVSLRMWRPAIPGALLALIVGAVLVAALAMDSLGVAVVGHIPSGFPRLALPPVSLSEVRSLLPASAAIALVAAADTLILSRAFAARGRYQVNANRDLLGLGLANIASGVSGGITTSSSAARTAVADSVGSRTQVAGVTAALLMLGVLVFLTRPLAYVPVPVLAAVVILAVLRLIDVPALRTLLRVRPIEFFIALSAIVGVAAVGVIQGVVVAMGLSLIDFLWRASRPRDAVLAPIPGRAGFYDVTRVRDAKEIRGVLIYQFNAPLFYANAERFRSRLRLLLSRRADTRLVIIDGSSIPDIDITAGRMLGEMREELASQDVRLVIARPPQIVRELLVSDDLKEDFFDSDMFDTIGEALHTQ